MKESVIKISVIVPVYNTSKYLEKCIESILNQSLKEIEVICINDGSIDNSLEILEKFSKQDRRVKVINQINKGLTATRNIGLRLAKGKYIINIDSDDWIEKDYFENIYKKAKENNLDMVISDILFDFKDKIILKKDLEISDEKIITGKEYMKVFFKNGGLGYSWNKLIKREIYSKNNIYFNEAIFAIEDVEFITRLSYFLKKIGKINKAFYHYRQGENNGSKKIILKNIDDKIVAYNSMLKFYTLKMEDNIIKKIKKEKDIQLIYEIVKLDYRHLQNYELREKRVLEEVKKDKKIIKKETDNYLYSQILLVNLIKKSIFPDKILINLFQKYFFCRRKLGRLKNKIKLWR
jgi:glycosyltransferase involved in cell wall biosynthesis